MFCPQCGSTQSDELKFCKSCGANLGNVRRALDMGDIPGKFDWNKTWIAEMLQSGEESVRKAKEIERLQGITPETKRRTEIKAGVITASVGLGVMILLNVLMEGIILSGKVPPDVAAILSRVWIAGVIPLLVGTALIINGVFVSKMFADSERRDQQRRTDELTGNESSGYLPPADTSPLFQAGFSVTDETTEHLKVPRKQSAKDAN
jgi:hypothetical protein